MKKKKKKKKMIRHNARWKKGEWFHRGHG